MKYSIVHRSPLVDKKSVIEIFETHESGAIEAELNKFRIAGGETPGVAVTTIEAETPAKALAQFTANLADAPAEETVADAPKPEETKSNDVTAEAAAPTA